MIYRDVGHVESQACKMQINRRQGTEMHNKCILPLIPVGNDFRQCLVSASIDQYGCQVMFFLYVSNISIFLCPSNGPFVD